MFIPAFQAYLADLLERPDTFLNFIKYFIKMKERPADSVPEYFSNGTEQWLHKSQFRNGIVAPVKKPPVFYILKYSGYYSNKI